MLFVSYRTTLDCNTRIEHWNEPPLDFYNKPSQWKKISDILVPYLSLGGKESLVSDIPAGDGNVANLFFYGDGSLEHPEVVCTVRLAIGFKQMVCTVATCYWFLALLWFYKTRSFLSL
jgi:hypothetical protein